MQFAFEAELVEWRGPAPFVFAPLPPDVAEVLKAMAGQLSYGWGCIAVPATVGKTSFTTSLFPRANTYYLPIKVIVQRNELIGVGDSAMIHLEVDLNPN